MIKTLLMSLCKGWQPEYQFHPLRRWRFDYALPGLKIAVEIEGGVFSQGRHVRGKGYLNDMEKYNAAILLGWQVLRYSPGQEGQMMDDIEKLFHVEKLFPCGLPDIDGDSRYSLLQKDNVMKICAFLANTEPCNEAMARTCAAYQSRKWEKCEGLKA